MAEERQRREPIIIVSLGTQGSGSTWIFNVVRKLLEASGASYNCCATESGLAVLDFRTDHVSYTLVKAHGLDLRFLRLVGFARSRIITSVRDARDSVVSQMERFDATVGDAVGDLSRALTSFEMLPPHSARLDYHYEQRFMDARRTIREISSFLGLLVDERNVDTIYSALRPEVIRNHILINSRIASGEIDQDPDTQWNRKHVGDGLIGKWIHRLDHASAQAVEDALIPLGESGLWQTQAIRWSSELFHFDRDAASDEQRQVRCDGVARVLVYGPYFHLPPGRWKAVLDIEQCSGEEWFGISADVHLPMYDRRAALIENIARVKKDHGSTELVFDHHDHFESIELRLLAQAGATGSFKFSGATLRWLGPVDQTH